MNPRAGFVDSDLRENISDHSDRWENVANGISKRVKRYCLGRMARDLEVRNCLKRIENSAAHASASARADDFSIQLERLDE